MRRPQLFNGNGLRKSIINPGLCLFSRRRPLLCFTWLFGILGSHSCLSNVVAILDHASFHLQYNGCGSSQRVCGDYYVGLFSKEDDRAKALETRCLKREASLTQRSVVVGLVRFPKLQKFRSPPQTTHFAGGIAGNSSLCRVCSSVQARWTRYSQKLPTQHLVVFCGNRASVSPLLSPLILASIYAFRS